MFRDVGKLVYLTCFSYRLLCLNIILIHTNYSVPLLGVKECLYVQFSGVLITAF